MKHTKVSIIGELKSLTLNNHRRHSSAQDNHAIAPCGVLTSEDVRVILNKDTVYDFPEVTAIFDRESVALMYLKKDKRDIGLFRGMRMLTGSLTDIVSVFFSDDYIHRIANGQLRFRDSRRKMLESYQQFGNYLTKVKYKDSWYHRTNPLKPKLPVNPDRIDYAMSKKEARKYWEEGLFLTVMFGNSYFFFVKPISLPDAKQIFFNTIRVGLTNQSGVSFDDQVTRLKQTYGRILYTTKNVDEYIAKHGIQEYRTKKNDVN